LLYGQAPILSVSKAQNVVGPQVRKIRNAKGWSQEVLSARLGVVGLDISRGTLSKIEAQIRCVTDQELVFLARALQVGLGDLFPPREQSRL
jgi:transcriptional regulator with XRE-family HTH domain